MRVVTRHPCHTAYIVVMVTVILALEVAQAIGIL